MSHKFIATRAKDWWFPNRTFKISNGACPWMRGDISFGHMRQNCIDVNTGVRLQSLCSLPLNTVLLCGVLAAGAEIKTVNAPCSK